MVYVHTNLRLIYRQREEWLRGKTKMWDVFPDDMGLDSSVELALANMALNDPVLEPVRFDDHDGDILEGSSSTPADAEATMDTGEEEDAEESSDDHDDEDIDADSDDDYED